MIQGIVHVRNGKGIPSGHCVHPSIINTEAGDSILLFNIQTGDAHGESEGYMTPDSIISSKMPSSA